MHGKYKNNKVWGGGVPGSVSYKQSPKKFELKQNLKLPPLNNKPIFNTDKQSVFSVAMSTGKFTTGQSDVSAPLFAGAGVTDVPNLSSRGFNPKHRRSETKPNTASQSVKMLDKFDQSNPSGAGALNKGSSKAKMRKTMQNRNSSQTNTMQEKPSEFNM